MEKDFKEYQKVTTQKFDLEDKIARLGNAIWEKKNEVLQVTKQLRLVEDQLRSFFDRVRVEVKKDNDK